MAEEIYVNIAGFNNYQVSNFGNVKNVKTGRILKPSENRDGYFGVVLMNDGDRATKTIHKLIACAFLENFENKPCIDHIDRNRKNNQISNLRWATLSENQHNKSMQQNNVSGIIGVSFCSGRNRWKSTIKINGRNKTLGRFVNKEDAIRVRQEAEVLHFGEFRAIIN